MIVHMFSDKVKGEILDKQKGKANKGKAAKDPIADFVQSLYFMNGASREGLIDKLHSDDVQVGDDVKNTLRIFLWDFLQADSRKRLSPPAGMLMEYL